jgi:AbrB family looped-hinge helix DNA binding protein
MVGECDWQVLLEAYWHVIWYINGMMTTMDKAGRVVIPAAVRNRAGLKPGTELEIVTDDLGIRLVPTGPAPKLLRRGKRLIAKPAVGKKELPEVDLAAMVEEERNRWPS